MMMNNTLVSTRLSWLVLIIIAIYPITLLGIDIISGLNMLLLFLISLYFIFAHWQDIKTTVFDKQVFIALTLLFTVSLLVSMLTDISIAQNKLSKLMLIPLALPIYILLRHIKNFEPIFWYVTAIGAVVASCIAIYDINILHVHRAQGVTHPIIFGNVALSLGAISLMGFRWFKARNNFFVLIPIIAFVAGLLASVLSLSRGGWVALPAIFIIFLFYFKVSFKTLFISSLIFISALVTVYMIPQTGISDRVEVTMSNIKKYSDSPIQSPLRRTSIGTRFEMWQASMEIIKHYPLTGVGWGQYKHYAQKQVDLGLRNPSAARWGHPHNEYFSVFVATGVFGFIAFLMLFLFPLKLFIQSIKQAKNQDNSIFYAGVMHIVLTMHFALSESLLERSKSVTFFVLYLVFILALTHSKTEKNG